MAEMLHTIRGWRSQRKKLAEDAGQLLRDAGDDPLGAEAEERFEAIHGEIDALTARIERSERQHDLEASLARSVGPQIGLRDWGAPGDGADAENRHETRGGARTETREATPWPENRSHDEEASFRYIRQGSTSLDIPGHSEAFELRTVGDAEIYDQMRREVRSINSGNAEAGGYLIAPRYFGQLLKGMETFGGLRESRARDWRTGHGSAVNIATNNDTQMADVVGYGQTVAEKPTTYGNLTSNTLLANSGVFPVDLDVLEDATETANLQADLWDIAGRRIERRIQFEATTNDPAVSGRGNAGLLTAAPKGHDAALVDAVTFDEMWILKHSVNRALL